MTIWCTMKHDLKTYHYRVSIKQRISHTKKKARIEMANWLNDKMESNLENRVWFSDETHFYLINSQNYCFCGTDKLHDFIVQMPLQSGSSQGSTGPWFQDEYEDAQTTSGANYRHDLGIVIKSKRDHSTSNGSNSDSTDC